MSKVEVKNTKANLQELQKRDAKLVRGIFRYHEVPGGRMRFPYKKYKNDEAKTYDMIDGQVYEIPYGVATHLNTNCWYPEYEHIPGFSQGGQTVQGGYNQMSGQGMRIGKKVRRTSFQSLEFTDVSELQPEQQILTVTHI